MSRNSNNGDHHDSSLPVSPSLRLPQAQQQQQAEAPLHQEGILLKRRDVFRKLWRPRYFVLQDDDHAVCILTYYLLSPNVGSHHHVVTAAATALSNSTSATTGSTEEQQQEQNAGRTSSSSASSSSSVTAPPSSSSSSSQLLQSGIDYDVLPRGTIYLAHCTVEANERLTRPQEDLYVFTITPPVISSSSSSSSNNSNNTSSSAAGPCFLATRTAESRTEWICKLKAAIASCHDDDDDDDDTSRTSSSHAHVTTTTTTTTTTASLQQREVAWTNLDPPSRVLQGVEPQGLCQRIENNLARYLPLVYPHSTSNNNQNWKPIFQQRQANQDDMITCSAYQQTYNHSHYSSMLKTVAEIPFSATQVFGLLMDHVKKQDLEPNVRSVQRLKQCNPHTFLDHYDYQAVWPTMARDLGVAIHWRVLKCCRNNDEEGNGDGGNGDGGNGNNHDAAIDDDSRQTTVDSNGSKEQQQQQRAICILAFSDEAADELKPPASDHVRADLKVSLSLIQPIDRGAFGNHCRVTRILSYDLCGNVPRALSNKVLQQQASMPLVMTQYLRETEPTQQQHQQQQQSASVESLTTSTFVEELSNERLEKEVIDRLSDSTTETDPSSSSVRRRLKFTDRGDSLLMEGGGPNGRPDDEGRMDDLPLTLTAMLLLTPLILWSVANALHLPGKEAYFVLAALLAVRAVVLSNLGLPYRQGGSIVQPSVGSITCRFSVDLKGVLRFIANRKEEQEEEQIEPTEVSVIHIVIGAIAASMSEAKPLKCRRVYHPWLGINGYYFARKGGVDISLLVPSSQDRKQDEVYNLNGMGSMSVQCIADRILEEQDRMSSESRPYVNVFTETFDSLAALIGISPRRRPILGTCLVIASPDHSDFSEVDIEAAPFVGSGVNVAVVVGGVRLVRGTSTPVAKSPRRPSTSGSSSIKPPPKPTLSMSITIDCPICSVAASRRFAERVQQLVQFPEMCED